MIIERQFIGGSLNGQFIAFPEEKIVVEQTDFDVTERYLLLTFDVGYEYKAFVISGMSKEDAAATLHTKYWVPHSKNPQTLVPTKTYHASPQNPIDE